MKTILILGECKDSYGNIIPFHLITDIEEVNAKNVLKIIRDYREGDSSYRQFYRLTDIKVLN